MSMLAEVTGDHVRSTVCLPCTLRPCAPSVIASGVGVGVAVGVAVGVGVGVGDGWLSYSSALAIALLLSAPPATSAMPLGSNVAVCLSRAKLRLPVAVQLPLAGSYNSALGEGPLLLTPAATSAVPSGSNVAA